MEKINVGVVGVGHLGSLHAKLYKQVKQANLVGVCDVDKKTAQKIGKKNNCWYFADYKELFDKVDAVSIAVPTIHHYKIARDFLNQGIHVLVEKPITKTLEEANEIVEIAKKKNLTLQVGHIERFNPAVRAMEEHISKARFIEGQRMGPFGNKGRIQDVGVVLDLMIHDIDIILGLVQSEVKTIEAIGTSSVSDHEDMANVRLTFKNRVICDITASRITKEEVRKIKIFQEDSFISLDMLNKQAHLFKKEKGTIKKIKLPIKKKNPLKQELKSFLSCIQNGDTPIVSGAQGRDALAVALNILENIKTTK